METAAAKTSTPKTPDFNKEITDKYKISGELLPSKMDFGSAYSGFEINLISDPVSQVDEFVKRFPDQKYFTKK